MTKLEKVFMAILILVIVATVIFWKDIREGFGTKKGTIVEDNIKNDKDSKDEKKDKKDKKDKDGDDGVFILRAPVLHDV